MDLVSPLEAYLPKQVWDLIQLQLLTGARPGEILQMRPCDIDQESEKAKGVWVYVPEEFKTDHTDNGRCVIVLGERSQEIVNRNLFGCHPEQYIFSPSRTPGWIKNRKKHGRKAERYTVGVYRTAIRRACRMAFPPTGELARIKVKAKRGTRWESRSEWRKRLGEELWAQVEKWEKDHNWHPHQLRHTAATMLRREFGLETTRAILNHRTASVTEVYAEMDRDRAIDAARKVG